MIMKKILYFFTLLVFTTSSFAQLTKEQYALAAEVVYKKIAFLNQKTFQQETFSELAYLKRTYKLDSFNLQTKVYINNLNDYYYKNFFLYSKLLNEQAIVTEDCITESNLPKIKKLLFYGLYPKHIKLPDNIVEQIEQEATVDEFLGPYYALTNIYFLKKYNSTNLSLAQKTKLASVEKFLSDLLYNKYIKNTSADNWGFHKYLALKVLRMNTYDAVKEYNISYLAYYMFKHFNEPLSLSEEEKTDKKLMDRFGYNKTLEMEANALLWIFLSELDKN